MSTLTDKYKLKSIPHQAVLVKLGGATLEDPELVSSVCQDLVHIHKSGIHVIVVHGGGPAINQELTRRGIQWSFVDGLRVTTPEMMEVIELILTGLVNRRIVRTLQIHGGSAVGFSGTDAHTLRCKQASPASLQRVGEIQHVNTDFLQTLLFSTSTIPVIAPIGIDAQGLTYNINADWAASRIASQLANLPNLNLKKLIFLTDQEGILNKNNQVIHKMSINDLQHVISDGTVSGGMLTKTRSVIDALHSEHIDTVHILHARQKHALLTCFPQELRSRTQQNDDSQKTYASYTIDTSDIFDHSAAFGTLCRKQPELFNLATT